MYYVLDVPYTEKDYGVCRIFTFYVVVCARVVSGGHELQWVGGTPKLPRRAPIRK